MIFLKFFEGLFDVFLEVSIAMAPLIIVFLVFQAVSLKLPKKRLYIILRGMAMTLIGLTLFLHGVYIGFLPAGEKMGLVMGALSWNWVLIPIGFILGFVTILAEPTVKVLTYEVEKATGGSIPEKVMVVALALGVGLSVALTMARIIFDIPFWVFILPAYIIAVILMQFSRENFIGMAVDAGGVATGPMTVTFILAMALGVASAIEGRDPLTDGFGLVALVLIAPIISVLILGVLYERNEKKNAASSSEKL